MRHPLLSSCLSILAAALIAGCGSDSPGESSPDASPPDASGPDHGALLAESLLAWQDMKAADDGTYQYTRTSSSFTGYRDTTTVVVENDVVVRRTYEVYDENGALFDSFDEQGAEVGSNESGAPARTIDELYEICRDDVLTQDPAQNHIILTFHDDGILETCVYVPRDCADDCDEGVGIDTLDLSL
jgi:major membrane immunogen (membrane-anchored lipoprotein)